MKKNVLFIIIVILSFSCSSSIRTKKIFELNKTEREVINVFMEHELASDTYKYRTNNTIVVIESAIPKKQVLNDYLSFIRNYKESLIDSLQAVKMKNEFEKEQQYYWCQHDFKIKNLQTQSRENFEKTIKTEKYFHLPKRIIFHLSVPIIINDNEALISFISGEGDLGYTLINSGTILITKNNKNQWAFSQFLGSRHM